ncbi:MAG TPA: molybdopterin-dependent oxidoreductase [Nocardioidaceae bacterium]|nr:molybdopterin-dependent oxidoreductase [Nocardioidaceae bacterium]
MSVLSKPGAPRPRIPDENDFTSRLRSPAVASRVGLWLGICFGLAFLTGLYSHVAQADYPWFPLPTRPVWLYRVTQGVHVAAGAAAVPLLLVKLWSVFPKLFARPPRERRALLLHGLERLSIAVLVAAAIFQLATGLANSSQWYPWAFSFRATHYAVAWIAVGALLVHIAVKLPVITRALRTDLDDTSQDRPGAVDAREPGGLTRRGLLRTTWVASGLAVLTTAGASVPLLRRVSVFAVRSGDGPGGVPINKTARAAGVTVSALAEGYMLSLSAGDRRLSLTREDLEALPQHTAVLPIACVEGWSATGTWTGVRVRDLVALVDGAPDSAVWVTSLQQDGPFRETRLPGNFVADGDTLLALRLDGEPLSLDHGYPCRVIAPNRPGVMQTKWVADLAVET